MSDNNFISIVPDGDQVLVNGFVTPAAPDEHGMRHVYLDQLLPPDGTADTLKITSGISKLHIHVNRVHGGYEDCLDVNNEVSDLIVGDEKTVWVPRGKYLATIKGGARRVEIRGVQVGHGTEVDVDLGNHSDQSDKRTEGVFINLRTDDDTAITYRRLNATTPQLRHGQRFKRKLSVPGSLRAFFAAAYAWLKKILPFLCIVLLGCTAPATPPVVDSAPTVAAQVNKDTTILTSADKIDAVVKGTLPEAPVKAETAAIRVAIQTAPAADVEKLTVAFQQAIDALTAQNKKLLDQLEVERQRALRDQAKHLNWAGFGFLAVFGFSLFSGPAAAFKTWPLVVIGAGCFGLAQLISHRWFLPSFAGLTILGVGYIVYWVIDRHRQGRLQQALAKRVDVLKQTVPVLDEAYENASAEVRELLDKSIFDRLSSVMSKEEKAEIHQLRAENKVAP